MGLTLKKVAALLRRGTPGRYLDAHGLYLVVKSQTNCHWELRYQRRGSKRYMGLGSAASAFTLMEARERARKARQLLADGIDPLQVRHTERAQQASAAARTRTFAQTSAEFFDAKADGWSRKHRNDFTQKMRDHVHPTLGPLPVASVDEHLVLEVLQPLWKSRVETGRRVRQKVEAVLDFATAAGYRPKTPNPARWKGNLAHLLAAPAQVTTVKHMAALPYVELPGFVSALRAVDGVPARALEALILTALRTSEVRLATWGEIDMEAALWTIPARRMKARREHQIPLCRQALKLLAELPREAGNDYVFIGSRAGAPIGGHAMHLACQGLRTGLTVHGFRSSFRDFSAERTSFPRDVIEQSLAHLTGDPVELAYKRTTLLEQRARLHQLYADFMDSPPAAAEVTPLRRSA